MTNQPTGPFGPMPTGPSPVAPKQPRRGVTIALASVIGVTVIVIAVVATMTITSRKSSPELPEISLQAVGTVSDSPFTPTVAVGKEALSAAKVGSGNDRGVRGVTGTTPGLYGSATSAACDTQRLTTYLRRDAGAGKAWSSAMGVTTDQMPYYVNTLSPVVLRTDAWVTNNLYRNGTAVPYQSILQAGTPVLVDRAGVPRVQCASGSPLAPPARAPLSGYRCSGTAWRSYRPTDVTVVDYRTARTPASAGAGYETGAPTVPVVLNVVDIHTGAPRQQRVGGGVSLAGLAPLRGRLPDPWNTNRPFVASTDEAARNNGLERRDSDIAAPNVRARQDIPAPNPVSTQTTVPAVEREPAAPPAELPTPPTETTPPTTTQATTPETVPPVTTPEVTTPDVTTPETVPPVTTTTPDVTTPETTVPETTAPPTTETVPETTTEATAETTTTTETTEETPPPTTEETTVPETTEETTVPTTE